MLKYILPVLSFVLFAPLAAQEENQFHSTIPLLDFNDFKDPAKRDSFVQKLREACQDLGFFAVMNSGVKTNTLDAVYDSMEEFFAYDFISKSELKEPNSLRGYVPGESAKGESRIDLKEFYHVGPDYSRALIEEFNYPENIWPEFMDFKTPCIKLFNALDAYSVPIGQALSLAMGMDEDFIPSMTAEGTQLMRMIHYPPNPPEGSIWAAAHTDINFFTILPRATAEGLQVQNSEGEWITITVPDGAFIINVGDFIENLTNGDFKSGPHRVVDTGHHQERYSIVLFVQPGWGADISPLPHFIEKAGKKIHASVTSLELLEERLIDLGVASDGMLKHFGESGAPEKLLEVGRASPEALMAIRNAGYASETVLEALAEME